MRRKITEADLAQVVAEQTGLEITEEVWKVVLAHYRKLDWECWLDDSYEVPLVMEENKGEGFWYKSSPFWITQVACLALRLAGLQCKLGEETEDYNLEDLKVVKGVLKLLAPRYKKIYSIKGNGVKKGSLINTSFQLEKWLKERGLSVDEEGLAGPYLVVTIDLARPKADGTSQF